ncbi:hypothetical protein Scep_005444 [Stephania cephalantha]|uniref:C2H2-type domain-containing protein n=1 Tax=Stephania cephalantha TaxID=152367 RepID=A0AAP0KV81_9MAGN
MEQSSYWTWMRRKLIEKSRVEAAATVVGCNNDSWEEQAFAQDSAGVLGGCVWPPRSYSCSFCRREFRSAQALGGHMNVHRRDRARLKQSPIPNTSTTNTTTTTTTSELFLHHSHNHHQINHCKSMVVINPTSQASTLAYNKSTGTTTHNPNPNPLSPSRVSVLSTQENINDHSTLVSSSLSSTIVQEHRKPSLICDPHQRSPNSISIRVLAAVSDSNEGEKNLKRQNKSFFDRNEAHTKPDSSLNLNLVLNWSRPNNSSEDQDEDDGVACKKRRIDAAASLPLFLKSRHHLQSEVLGLNPSKMEELDLELRLGDRPQVK